MGGNTPQPQASTTTIESSQSSNNLSRIRIKNELDDIRNNPPARWRVIEQNSHEWSIWITAEDQSPFRGVPFEVKVIFPANYPIEKTQFKLMNFERFFHPNISPRTGKICQHSVFNSRPASTHVRHLVDAFVILLSNPNHNSWLNEEAAMMIRSDKEEGPYQYFKTALIKFRGIKQ